jgi:hypothetical protein
MSPLIGPGTWMYVQFGSVPTVTGEILVFTMAEQIVAHRVITITGDVLLTKGDATHRFDPPGHVVDVLGVVRAWRRHHAARPHTFGCSGLPARIAARLSSDRGRAAGRLARLQHPDGTS